MDGMRKDIFDATASPQGENASATTKRNRKYSGETPAGLRQEESRAEGKSVMWKN